MTRAIFASVLLAGLLAATVVFASELPRIERLDASDALFRQQQFDMQEFYRSAARGEPLPALTLFTYAPRDGETLFAVAARLSIPYSAVATVNDLTGPSLDGREVIILPNIPGVFVPLSPQTDLQHIMHSLRSDTPALIYSIPSETGTRPYRFYAGDDFLPDERRSFLGLLFRHPVPNGRLTSPFGPRTNPITSNWVFHRGVDFAAPEGTPVLAARGGTVSEAGVDPVLGNLVRIRHTGGFVTVYGHLAEIRVVLNQEVASGMIIGTVGSTGMTTGAHLHFEIIQGGRHRDPLPLLP